MENEQNEMALNTIKVGISESFLFPAPASIAILGQLMAIATTIDFSLDKNEPSEGFKYVKQPESFRACLVQISTNGCDAFTTADKNMDKIRLYCMQLQGHVKDLVGIILNGSTNEKRTLAPIYLKEMMNKAKKCFELAGKTESDFKVLTSLLSEVSVAATAAKGLHESRLADAKSHTKILELQTDFTELQKREIDAEKRKVVEQLNEANHKFDKAVDEISGPIKSAEETVKILATGACIYGLSNLAVPVAITCVALKGMHELKSIVFGDSDKGMTEESKELYNKGLKIALKNVPEIYEIVQYLIKNMESRLCHETQRDGSIIKDGNHFQDDHQTNTSKDNERIYERLEHVEANLKELKGPTCPNHSAVDAIWHLCKRIMAIWVSFKQNEGCMETIKNLLKEIKSISILAGDMKVRYDQICSQGSDNGMVHQADEKVLTKIEMRKQNLEFMRRKQEFLKEKAQEIYHKQSQLLENLSKTNLQTIDFENIIETLSEGMDVLGKLDEQWHMVVEYFGYITNRVEICISEKTEHFKNVLHGTGYTLTNATQNIILKDAGEIYTIAYSVGFVAKTYTEISGKYLVGASAGLIGIIALDAVKDKETLKKKRIELDDKCALAQLEIKNLALVQRDRVLTDINEKLQMISNLTASDVKIKDVSRRRKKRERNL